MFVIGVDSGGTFTDTVVIAGDGRIGIGKSLSTPDRPANGVIDSVVDAGRALGLDLAATVAAADLIAHGTTVGLNALLTGRTARAGLLVTKGFEDTIAIARIDKVMGLEESLQQDPTRWEKPPALIPQTAIVGVEERVDSAGTVVRELDEEQAREALRELARQDVQAVGVSLLWSFLYPRHELRLAELAREELGADTEVLLSSEIAPRIGEYERTMTVLLNACLSPVVATYLRDLESQLADNGFGGSLLVMRSGGGVQTAERLASRPVETLRSGPVGGLEASSAIGAVAGHANMIATDVGGTSFDVGLIVDGEPQFARRPMVGRYAIASPVIDIESIGTGGGSIAWVDGAAGTLRVGPQSAGADPGPAAYGRGGEHATVTDAAVALGYLASLGGALELDPEAARAALRREIAEPLGLGLEEAAEGVLTVANSQMADLVRRVTVQRGYDPRDFVLYAFGGAAPQYAGRYAMDLGVSELVVPAFAPVFSAFGAAASDVRTSAQLDAPRPFPPPLDWLGEQLALLEARVREELDLRAAPGEARIERRLGLRFMRQVHELAVPLPDGEVSAADLERVAAEFTREYERTFGAGTAYTIAGIELVGLRVEGSLALEVEPPLRGEATATEPVGSRTGWFDGRWTDAPIWDGAAIATDHPVTGPAFIEYATSTAVVYPGQTARVDRIGNMVFNQEER